ncbi:hypothetical protein J6590_087819 [Homalodisca vitripennis]|nr:hypothetical protein J6590_087819 [Homalodisca vitripennis]
MVWSGEWTERTVDSRADGPRAATGRDGGDDDDTQEAARRDTHGPGLDSGAGQPRALARSGRQAALLVAR